MSTIVACIVGGCENPVRCRDLCNKHYSRFIRTGSALPPSRADRFWSKVDKGGPLPTYAPFLGPCWIWTASTFASGYGQFRTERTSPLYAHRWSYEHLVGPIPEGLEVDHLCRVRACVNPDHLEPVTHRENQLRGYGAIGVNARKTHCIHGHEFTPENTYVYPNGNRRCRACTAILKDGGDQSSPHGSSVSGGSSVAPAAASASVSQ